VQRGSDVALLARVALTEIEKALRPVHTSFWRFDDRANEYRCAFSVGETRSRPPLAATALIGKALTDRGEPIEFDFRRRTLSRRFTQEDRSWIEAARPALLVPLLVQHELLGFILLGERASGESYGTEDVNLLKTVAAQLAISEDYARLEQLARKDPLTEALNRHAFYSLVHGRETNTGRASSGCVAVVDVNDLKKINDTSGHSAGDRAIRRVASAIRSLVRADDLLFRWGGDEFLIVVFGLPYDEVAQRFDSLNTLLMKQFSGPINAVQLSVAVGVAPFDDHGLIQGAIEDADRAMYARKQERKRQPSLP
jgi:diguanylate cyclase (GGDEF)-like protein